MVLGTSLPLGNPPKLLFLKPTPLIDGMIAKISLKKYFLLEFLAYLTLRTQKLQCRGA